MLLNTVKDEFVFHCQSRNLSPKTTKNYCKQIEYLLNYLAAEYQVTHIEDVKPEHIKAFLIKMKPTHKVNYINDLLKAFKVFFKYAYNEGYTDTLLTEKIPNMKKSKVIIRMFSEAELKRLSNYYQGFTYLQLRNRVMLLLLIDTGIRMSELIGLTEEQLKYDCILIRGKGDKERVVPKSPTLSKWLLKFLTVRKSYFAYQTVPNNIFLREICKVLGALLARCGRELYRNNATEKRTDGVPGKALREKKRYLPACLYGCFLHKTIPSARHIPSGAGRKKAGAHSAPALYLFQSSSSVTMRP